MDDRLFAIMKKLEGMTLEKAIQALENFPYHIRVVSRDGEDQYDHGNFDQERVNVEVENGIITLVRDMG